VRAERIGTSAIFALSGLSFGSWSGRIPDIKAHLGLSSTVLGLCLLGIAVGSLLGMQLVRRALRTRPTSRVAAVCAAALCFAMVPLPFAGSAALLAAALVLFGCCLGGLDVAMNSQAVALQKQFGRSIMSSFHAWFSIGGLLGAGAAGLAAQAGVTPAVSIPTAAALLLLLAVAAGTLLRPAEPHPAEPAASATGKPSRETAPVSWRPALLIGLLAFICLMNEGAVGDWSGVLLREDRGARAGVAVAGLVAFNTVMLIVRFVGDRVVTALGAGRTLRTSTAIGAAGMVVGLSVSNLYVTVAGYAFLGAGLATAVPVLFSSASELPAAHPGQAIARVSSLGYIGFLVGPPSIGVVAQLATLPGALIGASALLVVVCVLAPAATRGSTVARPAVELLVEHAAGPE
jgi:MFS family permease